MGWMAADQFVLVADILDVAAGVEEAVLWLAQGGLRARVRTHRLEKGIFKMGLRTHLVLATLLMMTGIGECNLYFEDATLTDNICSHKGISTTGQDKESFLTLL